MLYQLLWENYWNPSLQLFNCLFLLSFCQFFALCILWLFLAVTHLQLLNIWHVTWSQEIFSKVYSVQLPYSFCLHYYPFPSFTVYFRRSLNLNCVTKISTPRQRKRKIVSIFFFYCLIFPLCLGTGTFVFFLLLLCC